MPLAAFDPQRLQPSGSAGGPRTEGQPRPFPAPWGLPLGLPAGTQGLASACSLMGAGECQRNPPFPNHLHPSPCWLQAARCLPDGAHRGKGGGLLCPPGADAEPSWSSSSAALTPCPWMGQGRGSKQADRHQRFLCHWRIKI